MIEQQLRMVPFFKNLSMKAIEAIAGRIEVEQHVRGDVVFREGDPAHTMYLVASGRVDVLAGLNEEPLASLGPGSFVGELSLLLREPRSATLRVSADAVLLALHQRDLDDLLDRYPSIGIELSRELGRRLVATNRQLVSAPATRITAVVGDGLPDLAAAVLARAGSAKTGVLMLPGARDAGPFPEGVIRREGSGLQIRDLAAMAGRDVDGIVHLLVGLPPVATELAQVAMDVSEHVVALSAPPAWVGHRERLIVMRGRKDHDRIARWVTGQTVGLALSSGGSKTVAHLGVLRVLRQAGIPIDAVAGTSGGALVAMSVALGHPDHVLLDVFREVARAVRLRRMGLDLNLVPHAGLFKGAHLRHRLSAWTSDRQFADTEIPCWMVATDVTTGAEVVINQGLLADAVRASASIPGVVTPWPIGHRRCIDGAVVNPLPANALRNAGVGHVIGSNVAGQELAVKRASDPNLMQIMGRVLNSMEREMIKFQLPLVDTLIRPNIGPTASLDFSCIDAFIVEGERAARAALPDLAAALANLRPAPS
ncbi:cyclic nucleotide-binding and patatin-like phospholipase domain-containing protein [Kitasatospora sp. NPDC048540]|uniref:cyclic nucleotide-binding and patatin-like phospholipase domain-containing protein n=1 Tax=unclassified Kitasatospora TaxID=2633591 RepID=UPI00053A4A2C|nr:cyclic nucleotide-binding and patatin-like phospholipase domain-containing protein [Kitasatospora sp. MBT63]